MYLLKKILMATVVAFIISQVFAQGRATVTGRVIDADSGRPPEDVVIDSCDPERLDFTDAAGRFSIAAEVGDTIRFSSFGYETATHIVSKAGDHNIGDVVLEAKCAAPGTATVTGRLISTDGKKPLAGVTGYDLNRETVFSTDAAGRFAIEAEAGKAIRFYTFGHIEESHTVLKTGKHDIGDIVLKKDFTAYADTMVVLITRHRSVEDEPPTPEATRAAAGMATVSGRVIDADSGKPIAAALAHIPEERRVVDTDDGGRFSIPAEVGHSIRFAMPSYKSVTHTVSKAGDDDTGDIVLKKMTKKETRNRAAPVEKRADHGSTVVTGRVIDADWGKPQSYILVFISEKENTVVTDEDGRFAIEAEAGDTLNFTFMEIERVTYTVSKVGDHDIGDVRLGENTGE